MDDLDFTAPAPTVPPPAAPTPAPSASAPFKPATSRFYDPAVAAKLFRAAGKEERFGPGQVLFAEDDKAATGVFKKPTSRMYLLAEGEVALSIGGKPLDQVKAGEVFGEMSVITGRPRSATATAKTAGMGWSLDAAELQVALSKAPEFALMIMSVMFDRLRFLAARLSMRKGAGVLSTVTQKTAVFDATTLVQFEAAIETPSRVRFQNRAVIMREGQTGAYMYILKQGEVGIYIREKLVEIVGPGGTFGEMAVLDGAPRTATAIAGCEMELLQVDRTTLLAVVRQRPEIAMLMLRSVAERLRLMNAQV